MENIVKNVFGEKIYPDFSWSFDDNKDDGTIEEVPENNWEEKARTNQTFHHNNVEDSEDDEAKEASKEFVSPIKLPLAFDESEDDIEDGRAKEALKDASDDSESNEVEGDYGPNGFNSKMEKVLIGARRNLKKIEKSVLKTDKYSIYQTMKDSDYLFTKLDRASVQINCSKEQYEEIESLFEKLETLSDKNITMRVNLDTEEERRQQMPKAHLMTWDGSHCSFHDFRMHMLHVLRYGNEQLNLSSLKAQIQDSKEKPKIMSRIENCTTVDSAFRTLEKFYGNIEIIQAKLKSQLDHLPEYPESLDDESNNVETILYYMTKMRKFGLEGKYIDGDFIHRYMHKLHHERCQQVADKEISTSKDFESFLHQILSTNQKILLTKT